MLLCLAGLRSIPEYLYEAAEVDRANALQKFWYITLPRVLPFLMLAVLFRGIENFKMFDMVVELTSGGPGSTTELASINLKREAFEKWRTGFSSAFAVILFVTVFGLGNIYVKALNPGEAMTGKRTAHSVVEASSRGKWMAGGVVVIYALITMIPLVWIFLTGFKSPPDSISYPPKVFFEPTLEGYVNLFTTRTRQTPEYIESLGPPQTWYDRIVRKRNMVIAGPSKFADRYINSIVIGFGSTFLAVFLGHLGGLRLLTLQGPTEGRPAVLHPLDPDDAADRGGHPDLSDVPDTRPVGHGAGHDPALHRGQHLARGLAAQGLHGRDPA